MRQGPGLGQGPGQGSGQGQGLGPGQGPGQGPGLGQGPGQGSGQGSSNQNHTGERMPITCCVVKVTKLYGAPPSSQSSLYILPLTSLLPPSGVGSIPGHTAFLTSHNTHSYPIHSIHLLISSPPTNTHFLRRSLFCRRTYGLVTSWWWSTDRQSSPRPRPLMVPPPRWM